jgi:ADP-ribose pyrophosphatase YjhB (NUDIX family)
VSDPRLRIPCVGAVVHDGHGRLLLVRRANPPAAGAWSLPGGRVEAGEVDAVAVRREVLEETGLVVDVGRRAGTVERVAAAGATYVITDYVATVSGGQLAAEDDAVDVGWFTGPEVRRLPTSPGLVATLRGWDLLPD